MLDVQALMSFALMMVAKASPSSSQTVLTRVSASTCLVPSDEGMCLSPTASLITALWI